MSLRYYLQCWEYLTFEKYATPLKKHISLISHIWVHIDVFLLQCSNITIFVWYFLMTINSLFIKCISLLYSFITLSYTWKEEVMSISQCSPPYCCYRSLHIRFNSHWYCCHIFLVNCFFVCLSWYVDHTFSILER